MGLDWGGRGGQDRELTSDSASLNPNPPVRCNFPADDAEESEPENDEEPAEEQQASLVDEIDMLCAELGEDDVCFYRGALSVGSQPAFFSNSWCIASTQPVGLFAFPFSLVG